MPLGEDFLTAEALVFALFEELSKTASNYKALAMLSGLVKYE